MGSPFREYQSPDWAKKYAKWLVDKAKKDKEAKDTNRLKGV